MLRLLQITSICLLASVCMNADAQTSGDGVLDTFANGDHRDANNYFVISAIKSISGTKPKDEFFATHWRFTYGDRFFSLANLDIAISDVGTDSVGTTSRRLTEAGISVVGDISEIFDAKLSEKRVRSIFTGFYAKIFNSEAYFGGVIGSLELQRSSFRASYFQFAYLRRFYTTNDDNRFLEDGTRLADDNLFFEFLIRADDPDISFFRHLMIKGGVLVPVLNGNGTFSDIQFRIAISVPLGGVNWF